MSFISQTMLITMANDRMGNDTLVNAPFASISSLQHRLHHCHVIFCALILLR